MVVALLEQSGVEAILQSDDAGGFHNHLSIGAGNNRVMIQAKDAEKALEIIKPLEEELDSAKYDELEQQAVEAESVDEAPKSCRKK